jgi:hypothetical protein
MLEALRGVDYQVPSFDAEPRDVELSDMARAGVEIRHVRGASDATYLVKAFDDELLMQLQLNAIIAINSSVARWIVVPHGQVTLRCSLNQAMGFCICAAHFEQITGRT